MFRLQLVSVGVLLLMAVAGVDVATAQPIALEQLTDAAALVVTGRVRSVTTQWDQQVNGIYTYAAVDVDEVWKGTLATREIVVKVLGGRVGDIELDIAGQARLAPGASVALWLEVRPRDRTLYPAGLAQGVRELTDAAVLENLRGIVRGRPFDLGQPQEFEPVPPEWQPFVISPFTLGPLPSEGGPARWHEAESATRVFVDYQPPSGLAGGVAEIDNAITAWNTSGMSLQLQLGTARGPHCLGTYENDGDGRISVSFNDPCNELGPFGATLGAAGGYFTSAELRTINGVEFKKFLQGVAVLSSATPLAQFRGCFQDAVTHNLGHTIGLADSDVASALMNVGYASRCSATPSSLAQDDRDGARFVYPSGLPNAVPGTPSNLTGSATGTTVNLSWSAPALGGAVATYVVEAGSTPGQPTISAPTNSTVTAVQFTNVPAGFYYIRVRARNTVGTGNPSNEIGLAVACAAPQPPTNLAFTAVASSVTLTWTPPASGAPPTSYVLVVGSTPGASNLLSYQFAPTASLNATAPAGTYYARLHARGACGTSVASNEVAITLPAPCVTAGAPQNFTHSVAANRVVSLSWAPPQTGTAPFTYTIEVGSASGLSNLLVTNLGAVTDVSVQAPPGTYFVRMRAVNACGTAGAASGERTVVVP